MQYVKPDISTLCIGQAASMGSFLLAAGTKGKRFSLPNSRVMVHQPSAGFQGQVTDIEIHANEVSSLKKRLNEIYSKHTGKSVDEVKAALERDNFMTTNNKNILYCSFCGKSQHEVRKLIAGPTVFICDECVELCMDTVSYTHLTLPTILLV